MNIVILSVAKNLVGPGQREILRFAQNDEIPGYGSWWYGFPCS